MATRRSRKTKSQTDTTRVAVKDTDFMPAELCCCPPRAMVWVDAEMTCCFIENQIDMKRRLQVRADAAAVVQPPGGPAVDAEGDGGSQIDEGTFKDQGKVYRTDVYTIHWRSEGQCRPLAVGLFVDGEVNYQALCIPEEGKVRLSRTYMLEPPDYQPPGPGQVTATLKVRDCARADASCSNSAQRP